MARMLGERFIPESVQSRRRSLRQRLGSLRDPIRTRREEFVPGPDLIGTAEEQLSDLRDSFVSRDSVVASIRDAVGGMTGDDGESEDGSGGSSGDNSSNGESGSRGRSGDEVRA